MNGEKKIRFNRREKKNSLAKVWHHCKHVLFIEILIVSIFFDIFSRLSMSSSFVFDKLLFYAVALDIMWLLLPVAEMAVVLHYWFISKH